MMAGEDPKKGQVPIDFQVEFLHENWQDLH
jgi:hypothetical protein